MRATLAAPLLVSLALASAQTLYDVSVLGPTNLPAPSGAAVLEQSITISAGGVGADGWTTYVQVAVITAEVEPTTTISTTFTTSNTFVEGASGIRNSIGDIGETCTFGADRSAACVIGAVGSSTPVGDIFSGSIVPFYTLAAATPAPSATAPASSTTGLGKAANAATRNVLTAKVLVLLSVLWGVVVAVLPVL